MQIHLHQTHQTIGDFSNIFSYLKTNFESGPSGLHLFPELFLCGYPLKDLCLQKLFIDQYLDFIQKLEEWTLGLEKEVSRCALAGGLEYKLDDNGLPLNIYNVILEIRPGHKIRSLYKKRLLPNYDIFDEEKYYSPGTENGFYEFQGKKLGLLICEDMWSSSMHDIDPIEIMHEETKEKNIEVDLIVNLSASPFHMGKHEKRHLRAQEISKAFGAPFCYVNKVGGEDEILFDGGSFFWSGDTLIKQACFFEQEIIQLDLEKETKPEKQTYLKQKKENTWEALFSPQINFSNSKKSLPILQPLTDKKAELLESALIFGLQEYTEKTGFNKFTIALSGGLDSALVCTLARIGLKSGQSLEAIFMPGLYTSSESYNLSYELCENLGIPLRTLPIKFFHSSIKNAFSDVFKQPFEGLADENIQSRLRGALLYARSNQENSLVINTSNKSELAVGYSTLYGDSVGAISMLGDIYKSEVFDLARYINKKAGQDVIPNGIIERPPSAELREDQKDEDSLPPYERLDAILEFIMSYRKNLRQIVELGFDEKEIKQVYQLYEKSEYKREQFCPIIKVKPKSFGYGHRVPLTHKGFNQL